MKKLISLTLTLLLAFGCTMPLLAAEPVPVAEGPQEDDEANLAQEYQQDLDSMFSFGSTDAVDGVEQVLVRYDGGDIVPVSDLETEYLPVAQFMDSLEIISVPDPSNSTSEGEGGSEGGDGNGDSGDRDDDNEGGGEPSDTDDDDGDPDIDEPEDPDEEGDGDDKDGDEPAEEDKPVVMGAATTFYAPANEHSIGGFVTRLYSVVLNRTPDPVGYADWVRVLKDGSKTAADLVYDFINSDEFQGRNLSDKDFLTVMYNTVLNRTPDPVGMSEFTEYLKIGLTRNFVLNTFVYSSEFTSLCKTYGLTRGNMSSRYNATVLDKNYNMAKFVYRLYDVILGRGAHKDETSAWVQRLASGYSAAQVVYGFVFSSELKAKNLTDEQYVEILYRAIFSRTADATGKKTWMDSLSQGANRQWVLAYFFKSSEFKTLCSNYGMTVGSYTVPGQIAPNSWSGKEYGIDVSSHQGSINWTSVKNAGYSFAIIRIGTYVNSTPRVDSNFYANVQGAKKAGLKVGAYYFTYAWTEGGVNAEISVMSTALSYINSLGYKLDYPVFWDIEDETYVTANLGRDKTRITNLTLYALRKIESLGYYAGLYTYKYFAESYLDMNRLASYDFWIAQWNNTGVTYKGSYTMWQYSNSGKVNGVPSDRVDLNISYKDYGKIIPASGKNKW